MKRIAFVALVLVTVACLASAQNAPVLSNHHEVKYVIFMVPDGMGLADVTAARIQKNGISGDPLWLETLEHIGYQRTYSEKNTVTDSSAAASTWACGEKFVNNEVCLHADGRPHNFSLLELAKLRGMATGLVATQAVTEATPAAFAAHVDKRACQQEIARQYVQLTQPDVMLGGGKSKFISSIADACGTAGDFVTQATSLGYAYVTTAAELDTAVQSGQRKLLGLFANSALTLEVLRPSNSTQPRLPDMTTAALSVLEKYQGGFFAVIEGSQIDTCNHGESLPCQYGEVAAFDESVKRVLDWIAASRERREHTLLIIAVDHETGGFAVKGTEVPGGQPLGTFDPGWTFLLDAQNPIANHTGGDVMIWSQGPGSEALNRAMENTWVYAVVAAVLK
jgi:alkaline phosphatase